MYIFRGKPGPEVIKLFSQLRGKFILLIVVKMPTIVGFLTFISMINTTSERLRAINFFIFQFFMSSCNFVPIWVEHEKCFITSGPVAVSIDY